MIKQYLSIKDEYTDAILFYRMGDFYEMFFEDAHVASRALEIALTSRNKHEETPIPMCGVPVKAAQGYISRLIEQGHKVAVCEQVEDPSAAKGIVRREVVRVVTPGMIIDDAFLDERSNNYILSLCEKNSIIGLSCLDISTGTFRITETDSADRFSDRSFMDEIVRVNPSEVLMPESFRQGAVFRLLNKALSERSMTFLPDTSFDYAKSRTALMEQFNTLSLEGFGCEGLRVAVACAGAMLEYVKKTQKREITHFTGIETYSLGSHLLIDDTSIRNLELIANLRTGSRQGTLLDVMDRTKTAMGARLMKKWLLYPLKSKRKIENRLDAVEEAVHNVQVTREIRDLLDSVYDLERLMGKIAMGSCNGRDLVALRLSLEKVPEIMSAAGNFLVEYFEYDGDVDVLKEAAALVATAIRDDAPMTVNEGGIIREGFDGQLDELISISRNGKDWLVQLEADEKKKTGISNLKVRYNKVFGYYIEVSKSQTDKVPMNYVRKQTLVNAERYITDELKTFEAKVLGAEERRAELEYDLFNGIRDRVVDCKDAVFHVAGYLARLDCILALADIAGRGDYVRPQINRDGKIVITDGRHPVIEKMIVAERFVPNSVEMDNNTKQILIITGPNMAGKSTVLRQTAILVIMAHIGSFVPASQAEISLTDRIFTRVGALDNLSQGQSTFMVEMQETANILNNATSDSLVILDEIGRGTSTYDGLSIAWAVAEYLHDLKGKGVKSLFATHYHELTELSRSKPRVKNYNIAVKEWNDEIIFLRRLVEGGTNRSYGIQVARLAGIPEKVIRRAKKVLFEIENRNETKPSAGLPGESNRLHRSGQVQLSLFENNESPISDMLKKVDLLEMTPLDALNFLSRLQQMANESSIN